MVERIGSVKEKLVFKKWYLMLREQEVELEIIEILEKNLQQKNSGL